MYVPGIQCTKVQCHVFLCLTAVQDAKRFENEAKAMQISFLELQTDFAAFTGSFGSWADGEDKKNDEKIEDLRKKIDNLEKEIDSIKGKMILWGSVGTFGTLGVTAALVACLGPVGLVRIPVHLPNTALTYHSLPV